MAPISSLTEPGHDDATAISTRRGAVIEASPHMMENKSLTPTVTITTSHLVKIVMGDNEIAQVSPEQVERVRTSTSYFVNLRSGVLERCL
jgi:hypothetical protein